MLKFCDSFAKKTENLYCKIRYVSTCMKHQDKTTLSVNISKLLVKFHKILVKFHNNYYPSYNVIHSEGDITN